MGSLLSMGWNFALSIGMGLALGMILDRWLGTQPWGILVFLLLGIVAGFVNLFRTVIRLDENNNPANSTTNSSHGVKDG